MENQVEIWKSHPDIDKLEVSSFGRIRTLDRVVPRKNGTYSIKGRVLKQCVNSNGYVQINISIGGKKTNKLVHRLVAQTFLPNPDNLPMVNHKDCNTINNNVENLEFCTASYNSKYREKFGNTLSKPVFAINLNTLEVSHFNSQHEASRKLEVIHGNINKVIKGKYKYAGGYWFVSDDGNAVDVVKSKLHDIGETGLKIKHRATLNMY